MAADQIARYVFVGVGLILAGLLVWGQVQVSTKKADISQELVAGVKSLTLEEQSSLSKLLDKLAERVPLGVLGVIMFLLSAGLLGLIDLTVAFAS